MQNFAMSTTPAWITPGYRPHGLLKNAACSHFLWMDGRTSLPFMQPINIHLAGFSQFHSLEATLTHTRVPQDALTNQSIWFFSKSRPAPLVPVFQLKIWM